jgi:hypothetical protein
MIRMAYRAATIALLLIGAWVATVPAQAQVLSYEQVRDCYCVQQAMTRWRGEVAARGDVVRARQVELDQAKRQLAAAQAGANPNNEAQLDNIRNLIDRVAQFRTQLQMDVVPSYNAAVAAINGLVNRYNTQCVSAIIFKELEQQAAAAGNCPVQ